MNPFAPDRDRELRLLERKVAAGTQFVLSQMVFDLDLLACFLDRVDGLLDGVRFYAGVAILRTARIADHTRQLPGSLVPDSAYERIARGEGVELANELASQLAIVPGVDALHVLPRGAEAATRDVVAAFRSARGLPARR